MKTEQRYPYKKVLVTVVAVMFFFDLLGFIGMAVSPPANPGEELKKIFGWKNILSQAWAILFASVYYFIFINWFYRLWKGHKSIYHFVKAGLLAIAMVLANFLLTQVFEAKRIQVSVNDSGQYGEATLPVLVFGYTLGAMLYLALALLIAYLSTLRDESKQRKILEEQKLQLEIEKSQANFNFLKAQINPHFLHNTLNFLYAKSLPYSPELSEGILTLSDIMRYALSEGNARDGRAALKDEIEHVRNVIKINQLRFSNRLQVVFEVEGVVNGATIIPFVLITLVENAFKHGDLKSGAHPIIIKLTVKDTGLVFYCRNRKKTGPKELSTGIGLDNIRKRLELAYGKDYRFDIKDEAEFYTTELTINRL